MKKFRAWFEQLQSRERQLVIVAIVVFAVFLPYQLIWSPLIVRAGHLQKQVNQQAKQLQWMRTSMREIPQPRGSGVKHSGSLLSVVERTANQSQLHNSIRKIQPEGGQGVRIWMDNAGFDDILMWLERLKKQSDIEVVDFSVERQTEAGQVNLRLLLEAP